MNNVDEKIVLYIQFKIKEGKKEEFKNLLFSLIENMSNEPAFINGVLSENVDNINELVFYETWKGTKDSWIMEELSKPYREDYECKLAELIEERIITYLSPIKEWENR